MSLADHRISAIETSRIRSRYPRVIGRNARLGSHGSGPSAMAVTVHTDSGHSGWGMVEGKHQDLTVWVGRTLDEVFDPEIGVLDPAVAALDVALHDLVARMRGIPLHLLLGGRGGTSVDCYSGGIYFEDLEPGRSPRGIDAIIEACDADWAAGYRAFKLKIGRGHRWMDAEPGFVRDVEVTRAVRAAFPGARLLVDVNDGYSPHQTLRFLREVEDCELFWIEEPFTEEPEALRALRDHRQGTGSRLLVADGEFDPDEQQMIDLAREGLVDVLLMDVLSYGITSWRRIMPQLEEIGVVASPHAWGHPLKTLYAAQLAAGLGNIPIVEGVPGYTEGVDVSEYELLHGAIALPSAPGHGMDVAPTR